MFRSIKPFSSFCTYSLDQIKKAKLTKLTDRSLLILNGPDAHKLLQGIITNDIRQLKKMQFQQNVLQRIALYTLFLQPKGKVVSDAFIFQPRLYKAGKAEYAKDELWLDIPRQAKNNLKAHLRKFMWKKRVNLHDVQDGDEEFKPCVLSGYHESDSAQSLSYGCSIELEELQSGEDDTYANLLFFDPRGKNFGIRIVSMQPQIDIEGYGEIIEKQEHAKIFQRLGQVPYEYTKNRLPFQFNYDLMNAISLKKGCFLGQQIVSRGLLAGIIRRRVFPFVLSNSNEQLQSGSLISVGGQEIGKVVFSRQGQGSALINYIKLLQDGVKWPIKFDSPVSGTLLNPFEEGLNKYYEDVKGKQKILEDLDL